MNAKFDVNTNKQSVMALLSQLGDEFIAIKNPDYIYSRYDICPLAPKITTNQDRLVAVVQDMDGTTTTTENLCLHSLETMVRQFSGRMTTQQWAGLDRDADYPHIIGNSTTKHVEYLVRTYQSRFDVNHFRHAYLKAALLTLKQGRDATRKREVMQTLSHFSCGDIVREMEIGRWLQDASGDAEFFDADEIRALVQRYTERIRFGSEIDQVRAAIDVYYQRYHEILAKIAGGQADDLKGLLPDENMNLIEPMPGVAVFLATIKGWLGDDLDRFSQHLTDALRTNPHVTAAESRLAEGRQQLKRIGGYFQAHPLKIAIVTSSIAYEAEIVLAEVFKMIRRQVSDWDVRPEKKAFLLQAFENPGQVFDAIITASDSSEIRLKPHRDLYSLALHQLGIPAADYNKVIGFEDSESGLIAIRAAGIGLCVAVPFADTQGHDLSHASHILKGGLPEALLLHQAFLSDAALAEVNGAARPS
ncbi:MAG: hypothetical protein ACOY90_19390 [Candidatus Zhuqueibacterota bacterium]